jgi:hypothetical protein
LENREFYAELVRGHIMVFILTDVHNFGTILTEVILIENYLKESIMLNSTVLLLTIAEIGAFK